MAEVSERRKEGERREEGGKERVMKAEREGGKEGGREGGRERGREERIFLVCSSCLIYTYLLPCVSTLS